MIWTLLKSFFQGKLNNKKSYIVAIAKILLGVVGLIYFLYPDANSDVSMSPDTAWAMIVSGYAVLSGAGDAANRHAISKIQNGEPK